MEVRINSVLVVPPSVWGENLMWIAMSHCGAYEASDATVECVLCVCYNCFKSVDLFTQIVRGSFHTFICSLWTVSRGGWWVQVNPGISTCRGVRGVRVTAEWIVWVSTFEARSVKFHDALCKQLIYTHSWCGNKEEEKQQWTENHFWKWNGFHLIRPWSQVLRCVKIKSNKSDEHNKIDTYIDFCILPSV